MSADALRGSSTIIARLYEMFLFSLLVPDFYSLELAPPD
jgi:hypothetical protein